MVEPRIAARRIGIRFRRRLRIWLIVAAVLALGGAGFGITLSPLLDVDEVEVIGAARTGSDRVRAVAGVKPGAPLVWLNLSGARKAVAALPWVDQVRASRAWGGKVTFDITERTPVAQIPVEERWAVVDVAGRVLQIDSEPWDLPVVLFAPVPEPGGWMSSLALPLLEASGAVALIRGYDIGPIAWVDGRVIVDLPGRAIAHWGGRDDPLGKADALVRYLVQVDLTCVAVLELSTPEQPTLIPSADCP